LYGWKFLMTYVASGLRWEAVEPRAKNISATEKPSGDPVRRVFMKVCQKATRPFIVVKWRKRKDKRGEKEREREIAEIKFRHEGSGLSIRAWKRRVQFIINFPPLCKIFTVREESIFGMRKKKEKEKEAKSRSRTTAKAVPFISHATHSGNAISNNQNIRDIRLSKCGR